MKKIAALTAALAVAFALVAPPLHAQSPAAQDILNFAKDTAIKGGLTSQGAQDKDPYDVAAGVINVVLGVVGLIFFIQMFWAGFRWMTAGGNEEVIKESKATIKSAIIGVAIALLAFLITNFIFNQVQTVSSSTP